MAIRRLLSVIGSAGLAGHLLVSPVAATPVISMSIKVSPIVAWSGSPVVFTAALTPVSGGSATNVVVFMETHWATKGGTCTPACVIEVNGDPQWTIASLSAKTTLTFATGAPTGQNVTLYIAAGDVGCTGACPPSTRVNAPTVTSSATVTPTGVVMPGDTLHFVVGATANVAEPDTFQPAGECVLWSTGLSTPTNISPTIPVPSWNYSSNSTGAGICGTVPLFTTSRTIWLQFDAVVTAALGATITMHGENGTGNPDFNAVNKTLSVHVGPLPTPTPKPTPKPTSKPTSGTTAPPSTSTSSPEISASPATSAAATLAGLTQGPSPQPTLTTSGANGNPSAADPGGATLPTPSPTNATSSGGPDATPLVVGVLALVLAGAGILALRGRSRV